MNNLSIYCIGFFIGVLFGVCITKAWEFNRNRKSLKYFDLIQQNEIDELRMRIISLESIFNHKENYK